MARTRCAVLLALCVLCLCSCSTQVETADVQIVGRDDWQGFFDAHELTGTFALHQIGSERIDVLNEVRASEPMTPASTFKILNSMIILETATIDTVDATVPWDGVDRGSTGWNKDHSLRSAIEVSAVWVYQDLAQQVGTNQMQEWVAAAEYGNQDIGGSIDSFWLDGNLRISALEQIDFLTRFVDGDLPFQPATRDAVREILVRESGPGWVWSHKTGLSAEADPDLGWFVGIVDRDSQSWVFALNVDLEAGGQLLDPAVRETVARAILEAEGVLPSS